MNLKAVLEGLLYVSGDEGISSKQVLSILEIDQEQAHDLIAELAEDYEKEERGLKLEYFGGKLKLVTKPEHAEYYKKLFTEEVNETLSPAALETLAIIAYNEPVTRIMVDEIRGVNSSHLIRKLVFQNLIKEVGKSELPGRPILYGVTNQFLDYFGLSSTKELPEIKIEEEKEITDLFDSKYKDED